MARAFRDIRMRLITRPWCCPEPRCEPIYQAMDQSALPLENAQPGQSFSCWGVMSEAIAFEYDGVRHENDLRSCHATALKGLVAYQENVEDWIIMADGYHLAESRIRALRKSGSADR